MTAPHPRGIFADDEEFAAYYARGKVLVRGNLKRQPRHIPPYGLKSTTVRAIWKRVRATLGREPQPRERDAVVRLIFALHWGNLMTPTQLNRVLGRAVRNNLGGSLSKLRRIVFEEAGATFDWSTSRWGWK